MVCLSNMFESFIKELSVKAFKSEFVFQIAFYPVMEAEQGRLNFWMISRKICWVQQGLWKITINFANFTRSIFIWASPGYWGFPFRSLGQLKYKLFQSPPRLQFYSILFYLSLAETNYLISFTSRAVLINGQKIDQFLLLWCNPQKC